MSSSILRDLPLPPALSTDEDTIEENEDEILVNSLINKFQKDRMSSTTSVPSLDGLPPDLSAFILSHLTVQEIASTSVACKAMYIASRSDDLWRLKFRKRWNYDNPAINDWFCAYKQAYWNPNDLWITHWNCVEPVDGLAPGRCCIQKKSQLRTQSVKTETEPTHLCPQCRYFPQIRKDSTTNTGKQTTIETEAQAVHAATSLRLEATSMHIPRTSYSSREAENAFFKASTFHRTIDIQQYNASSLTFVKDLLFFQLNDDFDENFDDEPYEMKDLKQYVSKFNCTEGHDPFHDCDPFEPALHSWHLVNFVNPDHNRPIVWRVSVQRPDCFTVFPSEGYLSAGESKLVVFGVKPFGSLLAHATQQVDCHREAVDQFWAGLYSKEAHLPLAPFLIQYHYASIIPCRRAADDHNHPHSPHSMRRTRSQQVQNHGNNHEHSDREELSPWQQSSQCQQPIRTFVLSAHVHPNYPLTEFRRKTLVPFAIPQQRLLSKYMSVSDGVSGPCMLPVVYSSPYLMEFYPEEWQKLQPLRMEDPHNESSRAHKYRTESFCQSCGLSWGPRSEELGQAFVLSKLESEMDWTRQKERLKGIHRLLNCLILDIKARSKQSLTRRHYTLVYSLHRRVMNYRGSPWLIRNDLETLFQWEAMLDFMSRFLSSSYILTYQEDDLVPWRYAGVYQHALCTEFVFTPDRTIASRGGNLASEKSGLLLWKDEPQYLEAFAHLVHSPGRFCLGQQEDPNHLHRSGRFVSRIVKKKNFSVTDVFMDDPVSGFLAAICILLDPRSLMVHGIFDRVPYPGSLARRPKIPVVANIEERWLDWMRQRYQGSPSRFTIDPCQLLHYKVQDSLDLECLLLANLLLTGQDFQKVTRYSISLQNFIRNVPPPGIGRFAFSQELVDESVSSERVIGQGNDGFWYLDTNRATITEMILGQNSRSRIVTDGSDDEDENLGTPVFGRQNGNIDPAGGVNLNHPFVLRRPRIFNLLWVLSAHLGWTVDDNQGAASVYVDRRILIAGQWISICLVMLPLFCTLVARYIEWIPTTPLDYPLDALPFRVENKLKFMNQSECGVASIFLLLILCWLGRYVERFTSRDFMRAIMEHVHVDNDLQRGRRGGFVSRVNLWFQQKWDATCPLFLQRFTFVANWNREQHVYLLKTAAFWRSQYEKEFQSVFQALAGRGLDIYEDSKDILGIGIEKPWRKLLVGTAVSFASFFVTSPHYVLNMLTIFMCSVSLGVTMSLVSMQTNRTGISTNTTSSVIMSQNMVTVVLIGIFIGQLVGSSGGAWFLAEFIVTSISLLLGGAGTISATAIESWYTFFCLSVMAFWAYLFARVSILESFRRKCNGFTSIMLRASLAIGLAFFSFSIWQWESVVESVIDRPRWSTDVEEKQIRRVYDARQLP
jgi:hypothetical protein